jgi:hypothetical protein
MSIAPLHGRPAPLLFVRQTPKDDQPTFRLNELKSAPLSSRAAYQAAASLDARTRGIDGIAGACSLGSADRRA